MKEQALEHLRKFISKLAAVKAPPAVVEELKGILQTLEQDWKHNHMECIRFQNLLSQAARLADLGIMAASIFHEMNQPLLGIKGFAELVLDNPQDCQKEKMTQWVTEILTQATRLQEMQKNVMTFLHHEEQPGEPVALEPTLEKALRLFQYRMNKRKITVRLGVPDDLPKLGISEVQLTQILVNLIGNAVEVMDGSGGGSLRIAAGIDPDSGMVGILIADTGPGIPREIQDQIFNPFFTTKGEKGTGLGLYIARSLAEVNGGFLELGNPTALGWKDAPSTVFELRLPVVNPTEAIGTASPQPANAIHKLSQRLSDFTRELQITRRILVVDDEPVIQRVVTEFLAQQNILADVVPTAEEALEKLGGKEYAVLLTDKNLPGMSGIELLKIVKQRWSQMEVIIITGFASVESALDAVGDGAFDYIPKPFPNLSYVAEKVRGALARYDFEVRVHAIIGFLTQTVKELMAELGKGEQASHIRRLQQILAARKGKEQGHVVVFGPASLYNIARSLDYRVSRVGSLKEAVAAVKKQAAHVVVFAEETGGTDGASAVRTLHGVDPDLGVFVIAREGDLKQIVDAIGIGVGDYLVQPFEGRELFAPRLKRLVSRQQRIARYRHLLNAMKKLNIDLLASQVSSGGRTSHPGSPAPNPG